MKQWNIILTAVWMTTVLVACGGAPQSSIAASSAGTGTSVTEKIETGSVQEIVTQQPAATAKQGEDPQNAEVTEDGGMMEVGTEYGTLYYPARWKDALVTAQEKSEETLTVDFSASVEGKEYRLFQVVIGGQEGDSAGMLTDNAGTARNVQLSVEEISGIEELSEEQQNQLYAMQEGVNDLLENLN